MIALLSLSGPFGILSVTVASVGLALTLAELATGGRRSFRRGIALCAAIALLLGIAGTGAGLYVASDAISHAPDTFSAEMLTTMWRAGFGIAMTTTAIGCAGAIADLLGLGLLFGLEGRQVRSAS